MVHHKRMKTGGCEQETESPGDWLKSQKTPGKTRTADSSAYWMENLQSLAKGCFSLMIIMVWEKYVKHTSCLGVELEAFQSIIQTDIGCKQT